MITNCFFSSLPPVTGRVCWSWWQVPQSSDTLDVGCMLARLSKRITKTPHKLCHTTTLVLALFMHLMCKFSCLSNQGPRLSQCLCNTWDDCLVPCIVWSYTLTSWPGTPNVFCLMQNKQHGSLVKEWKRILVGDGRTYALYVPNRVHSVWFRAKDIGIKSKNSYSLCVFCNKPNKLLVFMLAEARVWRLQRNTQ